MQAVVHQPLRPFPARRADGSTGDSSPRGEDAALLAALPIAAAVIVRNEDSSLHVAGFNPRFERLIEGSTCDAPEWDKAACLTKGEVAHLLNEFFANPESAATDLEFRDGDDLAAKYYRMKVAPLPRDSAGRSRCLLSIVDRTVEVQSERSLRAEMVRDSLTGLPNRIAFAEAIEQASNTTSADAEYTVLVVDIRRFSRINEIMGSLAADELLITFARRLVIGLRTGDVLARTGGNEFSVLVSLKQGKTDALGAADRIQSVMMEPFTISGLEIRIDCAIGIALMQDGQDPEELFRNAQFAVKQAKLSGQPRIYEHQQATEAHRRFSLETELRRALDRDELQMLYQPLIDLKSGEVSGFEALARWQHEERGEISPTEFIPVAEESGLILQLGRWALDRSARTLAAWDRSAGEIVPIHLGVNLSAIQVARDDIAAAVSSALAASGVGGDRFTFELTESSIVQDPGRAIKVFEALKSLDATVAMDDFGTGYSSLAYLQRLPIDVLKIDRSFVTGMMHDTDNVAIVRAILSLADALGMSTVAEGIETAELATTLAALGCVSGQGFYYAVPLEAENALAYWRSRRHSAAVTRSAPVTPRGVIG